ncbi:alpha/beta fold hydrolase [Nocardia sp. NPDC051833]|uniref:alpha/beta fold hydrolase n=1 Tax=Nocardia sp. NPDC051833 TaxID=3155674 RepID=UPI0034298076
MPFVVVDRVPLAYTDTGTPAGRPDASTVVFGHGLLFGGWMFRAQLAALQRDYRCVTLDWRGQGSTPPTADGYDIDTLTADAVGLLSALDTGPVHWVGLSMGGFVGLRLAARHPELLRSLTLLDTSADAEDPAKIAEYHRLAWALRWFGHRPVLGRVAPHLFGPAFLASSTGRATVREWSRRLAATQRVALRDAVHGVTARPTIAPELPSITAPTLVLVGADDTATPPARSDRIATLIPHADHHVLPACGHSSSLEQPDLVTDHLRRFLTDVDSPAVH